MTYLELYENATRQLEKSEITLGEYEEMIKPLKREIEQQPCEDWKFYYDHGYAQAKRDLLCEDCISREEIRKLIQQNNDAYGYSDRFHEFTEKCLQLPSVTPQPKTGHWIFVHPLQEDDDGAYICSCCGVGNWGIDPKVDKDCPNCGAKMNGDDEE